ncbi:HIT-like protein [Zopfochytrium polystomum]|nr:HIT-like protein [Zopfochytrium polystomum]
MPSSSAKAAVSAACVFCKIVKGEIPSHKLLETSRSLAFLDVNPLSKGHALVVPKYHAEFLHQVPDDYLADALPVLKRVSLALGASAYNVLQNNGKLARKSLLFALCILFGCASSEFHVPTSTAFLELSDQAVPHVHFHIIPKTAPTDGLGIGWNAQDTDHARLRAIAEELQQKLRDM